VLLHRACGRVRQAIDAAIGAPRSAAAATAVRRRGGMAATTAQYLAVWRRCCQRVGIDPHWLIGAMMVS
jgi:hypothetical protein